ncbi:MAG TPA: biopolymer transporter ExbD [Gammaproteobacteria bacterium]|nr:biopolymer transporter ExbD [Gammaproteobacteria bacterium]
MRYFDQHKGRVEIIPMIDIMLFLLVVFVMITLRMIPATGIGSKLPTSSTAKPMARPTVLISVQRDGTVRVQNRVMAPGQLPGFLRRYNPAKTKVTIAGAAKATVQMLLNVLDACRKAGMTHVGIAARPASEGKHAG